MYYAGERANAVSDASDGVGLMRFTRAGELVDRTHATWDEVFGLAGEGTTGHLKRGGVFHVLDAFPMSDGGLTLVGEYFDKEVSAAGVAMTVLGGQASLAKAVLQDVITLRFDADRRVSDVHLFPKPKQSVTLLPGSGIMGLGVTAKLMEMFGDFDYRYGGVLPDERGYSFAFRAKGEKSDPTSGKRELVLVNYYAEDDDFEVNRVSLDTDADDLWFNRGKPGYVLISEYYKKEKRIDSRLEKVR